MESKEQQILESAEKMVREGGYNAFSFRDIAKEVGIKSSSVHYHFPTKEDLGAAVANYYTDKFLTQLGDPEELRASGKDPIQIYIELFETALVQDKRMCLCGLLAAEVDGLPEKVANETKIFFNRNIEWLMKAYSLRGDCETAEAKALHTIAILEGAMMVSNLMQDHHAFRKIVVTGLTQAP